MKQRSIRIENKVGEKGGSFLQVVDADTGKPCSDISEILIRIAPEDVVIADITFEDMSVMRSHVTVIAITISADALPVRQGSTDEIA